MKEIEEKTKGHGGPKSYELGAKGAEYGPKGLWREGEGKKDSRRMITRKRGHQDVYYEGTASGGRTDQRRGFHCPDRARLARRGRFHPEGRGFSRGPTGKDFKKEKGIAPMR